ncbi:RloB domain-containing protein [Pedobacter aquae]|uniref:RloB domain-containing protein n=1 Tax=Pedobacter aquae TaxID=2605747 RepID=A0A5C0VJ51_9SPHI|nr:RloB domain-containing protein [Pedobacter aquae]QEK52758.1 RloB domain-containing protein [Pedobacter aquae]
MAFFDHDNKPQLKEAFEMIEKQGFHYAYSAMCIEHWFILHFENCGKAFINAEEALKYLKKFMPNYHKTKTNAFKELKNRLELALERATILNKQQHEGFPAYKRNPHFTINALYNYFEELKELHKS